MQEQQQQRMPNLMSAVRQAQLKQELVAAKRRELVAWQDAEAEALQTKRRECLGKIRVAMFEASATALPPCAATVARADFAENPARQMPGGARTSPSAAHANCDGAAAARASAGAT
eukprot:11359751-Alexandrium_andersonii.AAC.1